MVRLSWLVGQLHRDDAARTQAMAQAPMGVGNRLKSMDIAYVYPAAPDPPYPPLEGVESASMPIDNFHPAVARWFASQFPEPTEAQVAAWPAIAAGRDTLIAAPTGSGKTLAAFLSAIDQLVRQAVAGELPDTTQVVYVSPLKALSNDIQRNLELPLAGIAAELAAMGLRPAPIRTQVRTGDTPQSERVAMRRNPPHILVTTPESLYLLLTSESGRRMLASTRTCDRR